MSLPIILRPEVQADLLAARDWYDRRRARLGDDFAQRVEEVFGLIAGRPQLYGIVFKDVRRARLRRFPYVVYYRVLAECVEIIAVLHGSRDAGEWKRRV